MQLSLVLNIVEVSIITQCSFEVPTSPPNKSCANRLFLWKFKW